MKRIEHNEDKWIFPFVEYSCENIKGKMPLVLQLHGAGERGNGGYELNKVDVHGFSEHLKNNEYQCLTVMPQCPQNTFWVAKIESIIKFIEQIKAEFDVDENRIYLTGLSMGGFGTWYTAMAVPDMFAAIAPVCGGGMPWNADVLKMPIWAFHGVEDDIVSVSQSDEMIEKLQKVNENVKYTRLEGVKHNSWQYAYNEKLMLWLLEKSK